MCKGLEVTTSELDRAVMRGDHLIDKLQTIDTFYGDLIVETSDKINLCEYDCGCSSGIKGIF